MKIQNRHTLQAVEITKDEWKQLGKRQKLFKILEEKDSPAIKDQTIANSLGSQEGKAKKK